MAYQKGDKEIFTYDGNGNWKKANNQGDGSGGWLLLVGLAILVYAAIYLLPLICTIIAFRYRDRAQPNYILWISSIIAAFYGIYLSYDLLTFGSLYDGLQEVAGDYSAYVTASAIISSVVGLVFLGKLLGLYNLGKAKSSGLTKSKLNSMTKTQLIALAKKEYNTDLEMASLKKELVEEVYKLSNK